EVSPSQDVSSRNGPPVIVPVRIGVGTDDGSLQGCPEESPSRPGPCQDLGMELRIGGRVDGPTNWTADSRCLAADGETCFQQVINTLGIHDEQDDVRRTPSPLPADAGSADLEEGGSAHFTIRLATREHALAVFAPNDERTLLHIREDTDALRSLEKLS